MSYNISYRHHAESDFDIFSMSLEDVESTNNLLNKALNAIPIDDEEKALLDSYANALKVMAEHQTSFNKAKTLAEEMLQQGRHSDAANAESLAKKAAVDISYCSQKLFVIELCLLVDKLQSISVMLFPSSNAAKSSFPNNALKYLVFLILSFR